MNEVIKEFLDGADEYIECLERCEHETCFICGMRAESYKKLVEEVKKLEAKSNSLN
jgi:hypothetical protein